MNFCCFLILTIFFFWLCWFFVAVHRLFSSYGVGELLLLVVGSLASHCGGARALVAEHGSRHSRASVVVSRGLWVQVQSLWDMGLSCSAALSEFLYSHLLKNIGYLASMIRQFKRRCECAHRQCCSSSTARRDSRKIDHEDCPAHLDSKGCRNIVGHDYLL